MKYLRLSLLVVLLVFIVALIGIMSMQPVEQTDASRSLVVPSVSEVKKNGYPVNSQGMTYGPNIGDDHLEPDLILVENEDGIIGYVKDSDLMGTEPTLEEVVEQQLPDIDPVPMYTQDLEPLGAYFTEGGKNDAQNAD